MHAFPIFLWARIGLRKQQTSQSHFTSHQNLSDKCTTGRGLYTHTNTNTCSARAQHEYNDIRLHNTKLHNTIKTIVNAPHSHSAKTCVSLSGHSVSTWILFQFDR